ncbi:MULTISPECIES: response regulator transcription factor [unclassified Paenibacillus]|uniref:response regulator transcription factor n=1 Tax=unclassified Paenibacillus TaxID=185978 RepID=UPI0024063868|nr:MULTISPECIES: response regulator transcription factor [unclassified Paenibacillus]MDF9842526.1 DNA-binding response OmpR family regulator [Paenibacillus sp. PastF-2]MDF9849267.1 DNA-binding response OmpR family regulator [Paenibacillus sp. PastM-2]MDF9855686.1 DNA-binding response OmpR family regulator [Paenibacillus sp. PastF-1]MDH6481108.1 DNA-binding response OmpR family regulator [Paenibacillus sp. PastH-2]MDH6508380.1 DNA-binding response OmpR family regulator [Paenibacillus sp. PastM-
MKRNILYIEDNEKIGGWVKEELEQRGFSVQWLLSGEGAEQEVKQHEIVILDIMLPGLDGFTVGRRLKKAAPAVPILLLTARTSIDDKVEGLQFADDYLTKPFHTDELVARLEVLIRRSSGTSSGRILLGEHIEVDPQLQLIFDKRNGEEIILTGKQHQILMYFLRHPNQVLPKEQIYEAVWEEAYITGDKTLMVHIRRLRQKLERNPDSPEIIETLKGIGYRVKL